MWNFDVYWICSVANCKILGSSQVLLYVYVCKAWPKNLYPVILPQVNKGRTKKQNYI